VASNLHTEILVSLEKKLEELREASEHGGIRLIPLNPKVFRALRAAVLRRYKEERKELKNN